MNIDKKRYNTVLLPSLKREIKRINDKKQLELILKAKEKITISGKDALKVLYVREKYMIGEIKYKKPPYRLYVIYDQKDETFYLAMWAHKKSQEKIIQRMKKGLENALEYGMEHIYES